MVTPSFLHHTPSPAENKPFRRNLDAYIARFNEVSRKQPLLTVGSCLQPLTLPLPVGVLLGGHGGVLHTAGARQRGHGGEVH